MNNIQIFLVVLGVLLLISLLIFLGFLLMPTKNLLPGLPTQITLREDTADPKNFTVSWLPPSFIGNQGPISYNYQVQGVTGATGGHMVIAQQGVTPTTSFTFLPFGQIPANQSKWIVAVQAIVTGGTGPQSAGGFAYANVTAQGPPQLLSFTWDKNTLDQDLIAGVVGTVALFDSTITTSAVTMQMQGHDGITGACNVKNKDTVSCLFEWSDNYVPPANSPLVWNYDAQNSIGDTKGSVGTTTPAIAPALARSISLTYS